MTGKYLRTIVITDGVSDSIDIPSGLTLTGVLIPKDIASTSFTLAISPSAQGTYVTLKDPLTTYGGTAGDDISFTLNSTATGSYVIQPTIGASLAGHLKLTFNESETFGLTLILADLA